ncbi:MAG: glycosyltransferase family 4 protein [Oscillospiraceae bacterium]|nr:glycosyltransferase family 4 protein [Oscillospiraceae bacterium]
MKIVFLSNYFNHHQQPVSEALYRKPGVTFHFIATTSMPAQRKNLGYHMETLPGYVCSASTPAGQKAALALLRESDVVITGSAPEKMVRRVIKDHKLVFRYSERPLKKREPLKYLPRLLRWHWRNPPGKPVYLLCASGYAAKDYAKFGLFRNRAYQWGYFPETKRYDRFHSLLAQKTVTDILWCGRFLDWKRPEDAIRAAGLLKEAGYAFRLRFIGGGDREGRLRALVRELALEDRVEFLGTMQPEQVRGYMEQAGIYLFTSGRQEGWGAVLNEAMNSGCAVIASHAIGAVPFLIRDGENGLVYPSGDVTGLWDKLRYLLDHPEAQKRVGKAAYETIVAEWNAEVAAERLTNLAQAILDGEPFPGLYTSGPCSPAARISERENSYERKANSVSH